MSGTLKNISLVGIALIFLLSGFDTYQERGEWIETLFIGVIAIIAPVITVIWAGIRKRVVELRWWRAIISGVVFAVGLSAYAYYASNGPSDPDTAGHMHVILFPIIYLMFTLTILAVSSALAKLCHKLRRK
jgi:4-amino-4-deoxy-L-arabinose transferase-like glycosyltransferase